MLGFVRQVDDNVVLVVVNLSEPNVHRTTATASGPAATPASGRRSLCTQDAAFGGWDGAGNAFHEPWTQADGQVYINLPKWSVVVMRRI